MPRFVLLEHTAAPDDPAGRHFDLLLELATACRTWRLYDIPRIAAAPVAALELPAHRLAWLDHIEGPVSGGRGFARRVDAGVYEPRSADADLVGEATALVLAVDGAVLAGRLKIEAVGEGWAVSLG